MGFSIIGSVSDTGELHIAVWDQLFLCLPCPPASDSAAVIKAGVRFAPMTPKLCHVQ